MGDSLGHSWPVRLGWQWISRWLLFAVDNGSRYLRSLFEFSAFKHRWCSTWVKCLGSRWMETDWRRHSIHLCRNLRWKWWGCLITDRFHPDNHKTIHPDIKWLGNCWLRIWHPWRCKLHALGCRWRWRSWHTSSQNRYSLGVFNSWSYLNDYHKLSCICSLPIDNVNK